jgi:predicted alpha/beta-fold hydrolase
LDLPDGGKIALDWTPAPPNEETKHIPTLIIASGLTGGSHEAYIRSLLELITLPREENAEPVCRAVVVNFRGCAGSQLYTPRLYSGAWTDDFRFAVSHVKHRCPTAKLGGLGFSLGSNVLVKYLGEEGEHCPLSFAMSVSNPFDMLVGSLALDRSWLGRYIYSPAMANNLKAIYLKHYDQLKLDPRIDPEQALSAKNIREFDQRVTSKAFNYDTADDYYRDASSSRWITRVRVPLLCLNAKDDPITSIEGAPIDEIRFNPFVILALTSCGGHIGWFEGWFSPRRWCCKPLAEFTEAMFKVGMVCVGK